MPDIKRVRMKALATPLPTAGLMGGGPYEFGPDDDRIDLECAGCGNVIYAVPPFYKSRGDLRELIFECRKCGVQNAVEFGEGETGEEPR
jgi:hypothetical protein